MKNSEGFSLEVDWVFQSEGDMSLPLMYTQGLIISEYRVPNTSNNVYLAIDANTGKLRWRYETGSLGFFEYLVTVAANKLILGGENRVEAIDLMNGRQLWVSKGYNAVNAITTHNGTVFVASKGWITALDIASGDLRWRNSSMPGYTFRVFYDEVTHRIVVPADRFYVLDPFTGEIRLETENKPGWRPSDCYEGLQIYRGQLYCESIAYDATTGRLNTFGDYSAGDYLWLPPIVSDTLYMRSISGTVNAIDVRTMGLKWVYSPTSSSINRPVEVLSRVALLGDRGYAIADDATLREFDLATGREIGWMQARYVADWRSKNYISAVIPAVVSDGQRLYAIFGDRAIYAFRSKK